MRSYRCVLRPNPQSPSRCTLPPPSFCAAMCTRAVMCACVGPACVVHVCVWLSGAPSAPRVVLVDPTPLLRIVCKPLASCAPLPPPSQVPCVHCVWFHLVCLSCTHVLHTPRGHPHVQPTPPYGCHRAMWVLCEHARMGMQWGVLWWLRSSTRCTSSSSSSCLNDAPPPPYTHTHTTCFLPLTICRQRGVRAVGGLYACRHGDAACPVECKGVTTPACRVPRTVACVRQLDGCHARMLGDAV